MSTAVVQLLLAAGGVVTGVITAAGTAAGAGAASAASPWTPAALGSSVVAGWYDASNAGSISTSGSDVTAWNDLSGNANHLSQATSGARPDTGTVTINGLNALAFDGTDDTLGRTASVTAFPSNSGVTILAVRKHNSGTSGGIAMALRTGSSLDVYKLGRDAGNFVVGGNGSTNSTTTQASVADSDNTNPVLWVGTVRISTSRREIFKNGTSVASNTAALGAQAAPDAIYVGGMFIASRASSVFANMNLGELIYLVGDGATNRQLCEGYLAWKWGLVSDLDSGHPYKSAPP